MEVNNENEFVILTQIKLGSDCTRIESEGISMEVKNDKNITLKLKRGCIASVELEKA